MHIFRNAVSFAVKRIWSHCWLALSLAVGLMVAVALVVAIPLYASGVNYVIMAESLTSSSEQTGRQPFDFVFRYIGAWYGPITQEEYAPLTLYLTEQAGSLIGLPVTDQTRYLATTNLPLYPKLAGNPRQRLEFVKLAFSSGIFDHIQLVGGELPRPPSETNGQIEVLASLDLANNLDLRLGETYTLQSSPDYVQEITISGLWLPIDTTETFWSLYPADSFGEKLLTEENAWWAAVSSLPTPVDEATWRLALDGSAVSSSEIGGILARIDAVQNQVNAILPNAALETSPVPALRQYRAAVTSLAGSQFAFSAPVLGLVVFFLILVARLFVANQRNEIAVLRSRGASRGWILTVYFVEWAVLGIGALITGLPLGAKLAELIGRTQSFIDFTSPLSFSAVLSFREIGLGLIAVLGAIGFCLLPVWHAGKETIISYKLERARSQRKPIWQRLYLDIALLIPALYGLYTLRSQGQLSIMDRTIGSADPYQNPVLFLLPALLITGLSLLFLRILPAILDGLSRLAERLPGVVPVLVLRQFARSSSAYHGVLLLMSLTLGLGVFVSSMAFSLDTSMNNGIEYRIGADLNLTEGGEFIPESEEALDTGLWNFIPVSDHLNLPGVLAAARVGRYEASLNLGGRTATGIVMGVDWAEFSKVAFFRTDFSSEPLNALMNRLASGSNSVLVDQATWEQYNLNTGDILDLRIDVGGENFTVRFAVAGVVSRFPNWIPDDDGALFIANLDYLFESWGALQPYDVWLRTSPEANTQDILTGINRMGVVVVRAQDARAEIDKALDSPARQGVLGMLSVGFLASAGFTVLGFFLHAFFSFRERVIQLGVLRAIGLSEKKMRLSLAAELVCLTLIGLLIGTLAGVLASNAFIPYLPVSTGVGEEILPHISQIAWDKVALTYTLFGLNLILGTISLMYSLRRMRIFQAIKLGETI